MVFITVEIIRDAQLLEIILFALFINVTLPFKDKVSSKPVKKMVDEDDFDLMLNISDTESRFTDDDMEEEEKEKEKVQQNLNCDMNQNTEFAEDILPLVNIFNFTLIIYLRSGTKCPLIF